MTPNCSPFRSLSLALCGLLAGPVSAEVIIEFDSKKKAFPDGLEKLKPEALEQGVCITAGADVMMADAYRENLFVNLFTVPVRYAVHAEPGRSAILKPVPEDMDGEASVLMVVRTVGAHTVMVMPDALPDEASGAPDPGKHTATMDEDFNGLESVMTLMKKYVVETRKAGSFPRAVLVVRSGTTFGGMVDSLQLLRMAGCHHGVIILNDEIPDLNIEVKTDFEVKPPVMEPEEVRLTGRIVVNIRRDGAYTDGNSKELADEAAIAAYVAREKKKHKAEGLEPRLHIRGDKEAVFGHGRTAVRAAASVGVDQVLFAVFTQPQEPREVDLQLALPGPAIKPAGGNDANGPIEPFLIIIDDEGRILVGDKVLGADPNVRELPLLDEVIKFYKQGVDAAGMKPLVQIYASDKVPQQRVIDVLNSLAGEGINSVTFTDLSKEGE